MHKLVTYFLTVSLHHSAAKTGQTSNCVARVLVCILAGPLSCKHSAMCLALCIQLVSLNPFMKF